MKEYLALKWGTIKGYAVDSDNAAAKEALRRWETNGTVRTSTMAQFDTPEQKDAICDLIDAIRGPITNDWSGAEMSKDQAKNYVRNYIIDEGDD